MCHNKHELHYISFVDVSSDDETRDTIADACAKEKAIHDDRFIHMNMHE